MNRKAKGAAFKMKSGNKPAGFKMMGAKSPIKALDVLVDDVSIGTGAGARAKARDVEAKNELNRIAAAEEEKKTGKEFVPYEEKSIGYTGDDALVMAKNSGASGKTLRSITAGKLGTKENPYYKGMQTLSSSNIGE